MPERPDLPSFGGMPHREFAVLDRRWPWALAGVLLLALFLRWPVPAPVWQHVDERVFLLQPLGLWSGDLNPHFFIYPTLHIYLCSLLYYFYFLLFHTGPVEHFVAYRYLVGGEDLIAIARGLNSLLSAGTVAVCFFLGRRLYGVAGGLAAGLFMGVIPLSTRFAHLATTDTPAVFWASLAIYFAVRVAQGEGEREAVLAGLFAGLAGATKYPAALVCVPVGAGCLLRWPSLGQRGLYLAAGAAVLAFALGAPYVVLDAGKAWEHFALMGQVHLTSQDATTDMPSWLYYLQYSLRYGLGAAGLLMGFAGLVWPGKSRGEWVVISGVLVFGGLLLAAESVFMRYALPLAPLWALLVARSALGVSWRRGVWAMALGACVVEPLYAAWCTRSLLAGEDTRAQAEKWLGENAPSGTWVVNIPLGIGNVQMLHSGSVYARQKRYTDSYGPADLLEAYERLAGDEDLPPLYVVQNAEALGMVRAGEPGGGQALVLLSEHPACPPPGERDRPLLEEVRWERDFSPGAMERAVYDAVDWYFVPIGNFGAVERSGPRLRVGRVSVREGGEEAPARELFRLLGGVMEGALKTQQKDWAGVLKIGAEIERTPLSLPRVLTTTYLYDFYYNLGLAHSRTGRPQEAALYWGRAAELKEAGPVLKNNLGAVRAQLGDWQGAAEALRGAVALDPDYAEAHYNLGNVLYAMGRYDEALEHWQRTVDLEPEHARAHYNSGNVYFHRQHWTEALAAYANARSLDPDNGDIYFNLGKALQRLERLAEARDAFAKAADLKPEDAESWLELGRIHAREGRREEAARCFAKVLELVPDHPQIPVLRRALEERR